MENNSERISEQIENEDIKSPSTLDEYQKYMEENGEKSAKEFFAKIAELDFDKMIPSFDAGLARYCSEKERKTISIYFKEEVNEMNEHNRQNHFQFIVGFIFNKKAMLEGKSGHFNAVINEINNKSFPRYIKEFAKVIWENKDKEGLDFPEEKACAILENTYDIMIQKYKEIDPHYNLQYRTKSSDAEKLDDLQIQRNLENLSHFDGGQIFINFAKVRGGAQLAKAMRGWYKTLSYLTQSMKKEDMAVLFIEELERTMRGLGMGRRNDPDIIAWQANFRKELGDAIVEWANE